MGSLTGLVPELRFGSAASLWEPMCLLLRKTATTLGFSFASYNAVPGQKKKKKSFKIYEANCDG